MVDVTSSLELDPPSEHRWRSATLQSCVGGLLAAFSMGAAGLHFAYSPSHLAEYWLYGVFFLVLAWLQLLWAGALIIRPTRQILIAGIAGNTAVIAVWLLSRTTGVWVGPNATVREAVGYPDILATALEALMVFGALALVLRPQTFARPLHLRWVAPLALSCGIILVAASTGYGLAPRFTAAHDHGAHSAGQSVVVANGKAQIVTGGAAVAPAPYDPAKKIDLGGVPGVTAAEQARAEALVASTLTRLPQWDDPATAVAAGYHSIGDADTGFEHYVNWSFLNDDRVLDPDHPESLVYRVQGGARKLEAAMYMLSPGATLDTVPDVGGALMQWHIHDNLCLTADRVAPQVSGRTDAHGNCPSPLVKLTQVPMIHVWIVPQACGPFAALEGVAAGQIKPGQPRLCDTLHSHPF